MNGIPAASQFGAMAANFGRQHLVFDGHRFERNVTPETLYGIYLARKARAGDAEAVAVLAAFDVRVIDADGKCYWPPEGKAFSG